jgi:membrane protein YdbS with pleckstrin-like domain
LAGSREGAIRGLILLVQLTETRLCSCSSEVVANHAHSDQNRLVLRISRAHTSAMDLASIKLSPLERGQRNVMHLGALVPTILLIAGGVAAGLAMEDRLGWPGWPFFLVACLIALWTLLISPRRRWAAWGWALVSSELHVARGVLTQIHTVVPLSRVQHIDVAQGPVERAFGVARLVLHTAGTAHAVVVLPGLARPTAEELRDTIRAHVRTEGW